MRKGGNRVRIAAQLIDAETGVHLWADSFDGTLEDVFDLQDRIASALPGWSSRDPAGRDRRSADPADDDLDAYDLYPRARALMFRRARATRQSLALLEQAIARDRHYGPCACLRARVAAIGVGYLDGRC